MFLLQLLLSSALKWVLHASVTGPEGPPRVTWVQVCTLSQGPPPGCTNKVAPNIPAGVAPTGLKSSVCPGGVQEDLGPLLGLCGGVGVGEGCLICPGGGSGLGLGRSDHPPPAGPTGLHTRRNEGSKEMRGAWPAARGRGLRGESLSVVVCLKATNGPS